MGIGPLRAVSPLLSTSALQRLGLTTWTSRALLGAAFLFAACGVEGDPGDGAGGSQTGGKAGTSATGGTASGAAGKGGSSGASTGGSAGKAGAGTGGVGGSAAGSGGVAATGGTGAAGSGGLGTGGSSPTGGASGAAGTGGSAGAAGAAGAAGSSGAASGGAAGAGGAAGSSGAGGGAAGSAGAGGGNGAVKSAGCGKTRTLMNGRRTIQSNGNREFILRVPDNYDNNRPYRLIFAYHWRSGNANQVANGGMGGSTEDPYYGLWDLAENSTIFIAPEGLNAGWSNTNGQDVAFTDAMLEQVQNDLCIDTTRIFANGFSFGGGMSFALACARANVFRGVALYAGAQLSGCSGGTMPIAYFHAHGIRDSVLNISQGRPLRDRFVMNNGCTPQSPPEPSNGSGTHICTSYAGCSEGHPVRWCAFDGDHNPTEKDRGQSKSWIPGEVWEFFSQF
jgi:poly(3-hydroxybutyrate) depolymerase